MCCLQVTCNKLTRFALCSKYIRKINNFGCSYTRLRSFRQSLKISQICKIAFSGYMARMGANDELSSKIRIFLKEVMVMRFLLYGYLL